MDKRVEVRAERDESETVFANPDGSRSARLYSSPVRVKKSGEWRKVDPSLERTAGALRPKAALPDLTISDGGSGPAARLAKDGKALSLGLERSLRQPSVSGQKARYRDAFGTSDLELEALPQGFSERVIVEERPTQAPVFRFALRTDRLRADEVSGERVRLRDEDGKTFLLSMPARMWGAERDPATGEPRRSAPVDIDIRDTPSGQVLEIKPDLGFLSDPKVKLPITVDPTFSFGTNQDSFVKSAQPNDTQGQGSGYRLPTGFHSSPAWGKTRTYIRFPTPELTGKTVLSAKVRLYQFEAHSCTPSRVEARAVETYWHNSALSWSNQPTLSSTVQGYVGTNQGGPTCARGSVEIPLTKGLVQGWADGAANNGVVLRAAEGMEEEPNTRKAFASANHPSFTPPYLDVQYNTRPRVPELRSPGTENPANPSVLRDLTPTLTAQFKDADDADRGYLDFQVLERQSDGTDRLVVGGRAPATSGAAPNTQLTWDVPAGKLVEGKTYWWRTQGEDGIESSPWSDARWIRVDENYRPPSTPDGLLPANGAVLDTVTPTLEGYFRDDDPGKGKLEFEVKNEAGTAVVYTGPQGSPVYGTEVSPGSKSRWTVPSATPLVDNAGYQWRARAIDTGGEHTSAWSSVNRMLVDRQPPTLGAPVHSNLPPSWTANASPSATATAQDAGTGVKSMRLTMPRASGGDEVVVQSNTCRGDALERCPATSTKTFNYSTAAMPEGVNTVKLEALDGSGKVSAARTWTIKVDRSSPTITNLSGTLRSSRFLKAQLYGLRVDATDAGSGVQKIDLVVDGNSFQSKTFDCQAGSCSGGHDFSLDASLLSEGRHEVKVVVEDALGHKQTSAPWFVTADRSAPQMTLTGRLAPSATNPPQPMFLREENYDLRVVARDGEPAPADPTVFERSGAVRIDVLVDGTDPTPQSNRACPNGNCTLTRDFILNAAGSNLNEGRHTLTVVAEDGLGHKATRAWDVIVDRSKPAPVELSGTLKTAADNNVPLLTGSYTLKADSQDGCGVATPVAACKPPLQAGTERARERSGVTSTRIFVDDVEQQPTVPGPSRQACATGSCAMSRTWVFQADNFSPGIHKVRVEVGDQVANLPTDPKVKGSAADGNHITVQEFEVKVDSVLAELSDKSGLEDFFHYETTETGAGTEAHTNLATGNMVWHSTPIKNPGRGLSTVANLTYNSQKRVDLANPLPYRQTGTGFSLGVSGLTRLNEPLLARPGGIVSFTDPDGTRHDFTPTTNGVTYKEPPGVNLRLRRYSPDLPKLAAKREAEGLTAEVIRQYQEHWAITQPNGVTHFFDVNGYPTFIRDRNGNELEFKYELLKPLDGLPDPQGLPCAVVKDALCRVTEVIDPGGRSLEVRYGDLPTSINDVYRYTDLGVAAPGAAGLTKGNVKLSELSAENQRRFVASFGRITEIEDHEGRILGLEYGEAPDTNNPTQALPDRLTKVTEAKGRADQREWNFTYRSELEARREELPATDAINVNGGEMASVTDPKGQTTEFEYELSPVVGPVNGGGVSLQRVDEVTNRRDNMTKVDYTQPQTELDGRDLGTETQADRCAPFGRDRDMYTVTKVTDARDNPTTYTLDRCARLFDMAARLEADNNLVTKLYWDDPDNNVTKMEEGIKRTDGGLLSEGEEDLSQLARTEMTYNLNGMLTRQRDPEGHETNLTYRDGPGVYLTPLPDAPNDPPDALCPAVAIAESDDEVSDDCSADGDQGFVSDLRAQEKPNGSASAAAGDYTWRFDPSPRGNVRSRTKPDESVARTEYYAPGEAGPAGKDDVYGIIKAEIDEEGDRTLYRDYEAGGNPQVKVDPKFSSLPLGDQKIWRYAYDNVGNVRTQTDPRGGTGEEFRSTLTYDSFDRLETERKPKDSRNGSFVTKSREYDRNGNLVASVDGNGKRATATYTPMDKLESQSSPATPHFGEGAAAPEKTTLVYDEEDNVTRETKPQGEVQAGNHTTESLYDALGRKTVETRYATGADQTELVTSRAYDRRGNMISLVEPKGNAMCVDGGPKANAEDPGRARCRRFTYEYDRADRQTAQVENPAGDGSLENRQLRTVTEFDANDNEIAKVDPRGNRSSKVFDQNDRPTAEIDEEGRRKETRYYRDDKVLAEVSPKGTASAAGGDYTTTHTYDPNGDPETRSLPYDENQYGSKDLKVRYERDPVGNPTRITDARGNSFTNTFFDSGELRSTGRPSWFKYESGQGGSSQQGESGGSGQSGEGGGSGQGQGKGAGQGQAGIVSEKSPEELVKGKESPEPDLPTSEANGDLGEVRPAKMPEIMPKAGQTTLDYDNEMRLTSVKDAANATSTLTHDAVGRTVEMRRPLDVSANRWIVEKMAYDRNGNLRQSIDGRDHATTTVFDGFDRPIERTEPGSDDGPETTKVDYDANDKVVREETPRGTDSETVYDRIDRTLSETNPAGEKTTQVNDRNGNKIAETSPRGNASGGDSEIFTTRYRYDKANQKVEMEDGFDQKTLYRYDANGNEVEQDAPGASSGPGQGSDRRVTKRAFEGRDLPWKETTGQGSHKRTTVTEHDPNGNMRREVKPAGVNESSELPHFTYSTDDAVGGADANKHATVRDYRADDILTAIHQPYGRPTHSGDPMADPTDEKDKKRYVQRFDHSDRGFVTSIVAPHTASEADSEEKKRRLTTSYEHFDTGWIKSQKDPEYERSSNKRQEIDYEYDAAGNQTRWNTEGKRSIRRSYYPSGKVSRREAAGKTGSDGTRTERHYTYGYNENGTLDEAKDLEKNRTTRIYLDDAERELLVNEDWSGGKDSSFDYDPDGNVLERDTDGKWDGGSSYELSDDKEATFVLDRLGREEKTTVNPEIGGNRVTNTTYHPSGERETRRRNELSDGDPAVTESTYHYSDGRLSRMRRTRRGGAELKDKTYTYDRNGNRKQDERGDYQFNARDQVTKWNRGDQAKLSGAVSYELNGSGSMTRQEDTTNGGSNTSYSYDGDRLMESQTSGPGGSTSSTYSYDDFGSTTQISQSGGSGGGGAQNTGMDYDEFGRMKKGTGPDGKQVTYTYDALDRRDSKSQDGQSQDMSYIGTSESLSEEAGAGKDRSYDYSSDMERLGQASGDGSDSTYKGYAKDANGSVEGLEEDNGEVKSENKYSYDPYGEPEKQMGSNGQPQDPEAQLGEAAKGNPFRYEGFYQDAAIKSYDMQARPYRPEIGRFLTQDRYEESQGDFELQSDPLTQNRYAFAGGNPVNNVEWDGHYAWGMGYLAGRQPVAPQRRQVQPQQAKPQPPKPRPTAQRGFAAQQRQQFARTNRQLNRQADQGRRQAQGSAGDRFGGEVKGLTGLHVGGDKNNPGYKKGEKLGEAAGVASAATGIGGVVRAGVKKLAKEGGEEAAEGAATQGGRTGARGTDDAAGSVKPKPGSAGGPTAGKRFPERVRREALDENPDTCVYCGMKTDKPQVDHVISRARGGNATKENAQTTCWHCNPSKGAGVAPKTPPPGYRGAWPRSW